MPSVVTTSRPPRKTPPSRAAKPARRYPLSDEFYQHAIKNAVHESLFSPVTLEEKHEVRLKPGFQTACWAYLPPHRIYVGTDIFEKETVKPGLTPAQQEKYIANHFHHEFGHCLFTARDLRKTQQVLDTFKCPFSLYNLFEDGYMEDRYRREAEYAFNWTEYEYVTFSPRPESLLFALIQTEGNLAQVQEELNRWEAKASPVEGLMLIPLPGVAPSQTLTEMLPKVYAYFLRIVAVTESMHLMPLLKAWIDEYGLPPASAGSGMGDLSFSAELMTKPASLESFDHDTQVVSGANVSADTSLPTDKRPPGKKAVPKPNDKAVARRGTVLHRKATTVDMGRAKAIALKLLKFFATKTRTVSTRTPQRRVSARHFAVGRAPYRVTEHERRGKKKVFVEVDCSGSMRGFHIMEGKILVAALSLLAEQGHIEGHVALSAVLESGPSWELFELPLAPEVINRIQGYAGAEGLEYTMQENLKLLKEADYVFVYTDGQICDLPIDKEAFHRQGVYTWGLYAGDDPSLLEKMMEYFDKAIIRGSAEALADAMLVQNK